MSGKELISASGKGHSKIASTWVVAVVFCAVFMITATVVANSLSGSINDARPSSTSQFYDIVPSARASRNAQLDDAQNVVKVFIPAAVIISVFYLIYGFVYTGRISKNCVNVHEDVIKGLSINNTDFHLTYDQVSSVDVESGGKTLVIHAGNTKHNIYIMNANEVRDVIMAQKKAVGQAA
jgi:hypothetical protein